MTVTPIGTYPVPIGAIVAAEAPGGGGLVVHRVVGRSAAGFLLRGDNATHADGIVPEEAVIGVVVRIERNGRLVRQAPGSMRRPFAALVRAGVVRRLNRLRGHARRFVPSGLLALRERRR
ncbi:MAG: S24/S26 family peptidase [Holophagales bacterium]|nr:S24/S26 family peptidase [Holophagales bacterium]